MLRISTQLITLGNDTTCQLQKEFVLKLIYSAQKKKESTHHDVIRQLVWKSLKAVIEGFIVTGNLFPAKALIYNDVRPTATQTHFHLKPLLSSLLYLV